MSFQEFDQGNTGLTEKKRPKSVGHQCLRECIQVQVYYGFS